MKSDADSERILGLDFFVGNLEQAVEAGFNGGLVTVPSAPVLDMMTRDRVTREALEQSDLVLPDSGLMVALWRVLSPGTQLRRISGLRYLDALLAHPRFRKEGGALWVMPSETSREKNLVWLRSQEIETAAGDCYVAPKYPVGELRDEALLAFLKKRMERRAAAPPRHLILAIAGGVQERLGLFLRKQFGTRLCIHCIGGAIGFLTGDQAPIPRWADALYLGWLIRCLADPGRYLPRYWRSVRVAPLLLRHRKSWLQAKK